MLFTNVVFEEFELSCVQVKNKKFIANFKLEQDDDDNGPFTTHHMISGHYCENRVPAFIFGLLEEHVKVINQQTDATDISLQRIEIEHLGSGADKQYMVRFGYSYNTNVGEGYSSSKTGKMILQKGQKGEYKKSKEILEHITGLERNLYDFIVLGNKFKAEISKAEMKGNTLEVV